jgi:hypothetical protein
MKKLKDSLLDSLQDEYRVEITQEIIDRSKLWCPWRCIGANALKSVVKAESIHWGSTFGYVDDARYNSYSISGDPIDMREISSPTTVIFKRVK